MKDGEHGGNERLGVVQAVEAGRAIIVTWAFTLVEVVKFKGKDSSDGFIKIGQNNREALERCFDPSSGATIVNVDYETAAKARDAVWERNFDPKDAVHVACAVQFKELAMDDADELLFQTFDKTLIKRANGFCGIRFAEPSHDEFPCQPGLFE